uniref:Uncharacterized protein n=1 Tax=viral metagenome TaxID=1070528 RepID=A0A6C0KVR0_9ZZZZ
MSLFRIYHPFHRALQRSMCNQQCTYKYPYMTICGLISYITLTSMFEQEQRRKDMDVLKKELRSIRLH